MTLNLPMNQYRRAPGQRTQGGFSLVTAIFLLVVLAGLGTAMMTIFTIHQSSSAMDVQGARAYQAARSGIEWGLYQRLRVAVPALACPDIAVAAVPVSFAPPAPTLSQFTVSVSCNLTSGPGALQRWRISATACNQPQLAEPRCPNRNASPDYVERVVQVEF